MENKQGKGRRRLPQWYSEKVNMAAEVFAGNPDYANLSRPHVDPFAGGQGVSAQRQGRMTVKQPGLDLDPATPDNDALLEV